VDCTGIQTKDIQIVVVISLFPLMKLEGLMLIIPKYGTEMFSLMNLNFCSVLK